VSQSVAAARQGRPTTEARSKDPATRLQQLIAAQMDPPTSKAPKPLAVIVSGNIEPENVIDILERQLGDAAPGKLGDPSPPAPSVPPKIVHERIPTPLSQGAIGYVVEGPPPGTREALVWRMLLYVLIHDYSGRLGRSAISDKGIVYHIYSSLRTDGLRSWATLSTGVDPDKADALEAELRTHLAGLVRNPPSAAEVEAARSHLLGRDLTAAQSNEELAAKLARVFVETGGLRSHEQLRALLQTITPADLADAAQSFASGTIVRVDVGAPAP
jgi:predicted Zn-dependent peptidase